MSKKLPTMIREDVPFDNILKYYHFSFYCANCDKHDQVSIRKGVLAKDVFPIKCDNCGCQIPLK